MTNSIDPTQLQQAADAAKLALEEEQRKGNPTATSIADGVGSLAEGAADVAASGALEIAGSVAGAVVEGAGAVLGGAAEVAGSVVVGIISGIFDS